MCVLSRVLAVCLALVIGLPGCGEEGSGQPARKSPPGPVVPAGPGVDADRVPLSGADPAHVVGASSFNRFHLRTLEAVPNAGRDLAPLAASRPAGKEKAADMLLARARHVLTQLRQGQVRAAARGLADLAKLAADLGWPAAEERLLRYALQIQHTLTDRLEMLASLKRIMQLQVARKDRLAATRTRADLGCIYAILGNHARGLDHLGAAARGFEKMGRPVARAEALAGLGLVHVRRSEYSAALDVLDASRALMDVAPARAGQAYVRSLLGNAYEDMGDLDRARDFYKAAMKLHGKRRSLDAGDVLGNLGSVHFDLGEYDDAVFYFERAHGMFQLLKDNAGTANALFSLGRVKKVQGGYRTALEIYDRALALQPNESPAAARTLCAKAETYLAMGRVDDALNEIHTAIERTDEGSGPVVQVELLVVEALAHLRKNDPVAAVERIRRALDLLMEVTAGLADEHVVGVRERRAWVFDAGIAVALKAGRVDLAVEFIEHGRAGALLEGLGGRGGRRGLPAALVEAETIAAQRLAQANRDYQRARAARRMKELRAADATRKVAATSYRTVQQRIQRESKRIADVFHPVPDSLAAIRHELVEGDVLVLYTLLPFQAYAVVITPKDARTVWLGNTPDIRKACEGLHVDAREAGGKDPEAAWKRLRALRRQVIDPLGLPDDTRRLLLSPDGPLCYVPFPLLFETSRLEVACLPSGTTLRLLAQERSLKGEGVLAVGDPNYEIEYEGHSLQVYAEGVPLEPLPATRKEVMAITGDDDVRLLGNFSTVSGLTEAAAARKRWRVIHLACHGLIDPRTPTLSALALTPDGGDDGFLTALEIYGMHLPTDLAVLSGCNTGRGKFAKGEGLVGLMRAFMCAGSPRIVVSLWKVDDAATQALMTRFHELWRKDGRSTARALQEAQREIATEERWRHPRYWGAWVLWGLPD